MYPFSSGGDFVEPFTTLMTLSALEHFGPWNGVEASLDLGLPMGMLQGGLYLHPLLPQNQCVLPSQACSLTRTMALQVDTNPVFPEASSRGVVSVVLGGWSQQQENRSKGKSWIQPQLCPYAPPPHLLSVEANELEGAYAGRAGRAACLSHRLSATGAGPTGTGGLSP